MTAVLSDEQLIAADYALSDLTRARRSNRLATLSRFDAFYKVYVTAFTAAVGIYLGAGLFGNVKVDESTVDRVKHLGPVYGSLLVALAIAVGLRSGGRGGPLAFEKADVRHVLLAPVDRNTSVRRAAIRQLRHGIFIGASIGGSAGVVALRQMPGSPVLWVICGVVCGGLVIAASMGIAMIAGGLRLPRPLTDGIAVLIAGWAAVDAVLQVQTSPMSWIASVGLWPIQFFSLGIAGLAVGSIAVVIGLVSVAGISVEAAERRSTLVGQLRFAATLQDVRTVMVLQRQLAQEHLRGRPWIRIRSPRNNNLDRLGQPKAGVSIRRSAHGFLRWPAVRLVRLIALALIAGFAVCGAWATTPVLVVVAGIALWIAALDLLEALAQESDRPDRLDSAPVAVGRAHVRLTIFPIVGMALLVAIGSIPVLVIGNPEVVAGLSFVWVLAVFVPIGGAALIVSRPTGGGDAGVMPEIASARMALKLGAPPAIATMAFAPIAVARYNISHGEALPKAIAGSQTVSTAALVLGVMSLLWVRYAPEVRASLNDAGENARQQADGKAEKAKPGDKNESGKHGPVTKQANRKTGSGRSGPAAKKPVSKNKQSGQRKKK